MKLVFLMAAIITSVAVAAQSPHLLDDHNLQDSLKRLPGIHVLKDGQVVMPSQSPELLKRLPGVLVLKDGQVVSPSQSPEPENQLLTEMENGNKLLVLPQDQMPCVVPDMNQFNMPNAGAGLVIKPYPANPGAIPNPYQRNNLIPTKPKK